MKLLALRPKCSAACEEPWPLPKRWIRVGECLSEGADVSEMEWVPVGQDKSVPSSSAQECIDHDAVNTIVPEGLDE